MKDLIYFSVVCFSIAFIIIKVSTAFPKSDHVVFQEPDPRVVKQLIETKKVILNIHKFALIVSPFALLCLIIGMTVKSR